MNNLKLYVYKSSNYFRIMMMTIYILSRILRLILVSHVYCTPVTSIGELN